jgi:hypothetical protein
MIMAYFMGLSVSEEIDHVKGNFFKDMGELKKTFF